MKDYNKIDEYEVWQIKSSVSQFLVPRLKLFIQKIENGESVTIPIWLERTNDISKKSEKELKSLWIETLKKMLIPFECQTTPEKFLEITHEVLEQKKKEGLQLFAEYFDNLWD